MEPIVEYCITGRKIANTGTDCQASTKLPAKWMERRHRTMYTWPSAKSCRCCFFHACTQQVVGSASSKNHVLGELLPSVSDPPCAVQRILPSGGPLKRGGGSIVSVEQQGGHQSESQPMKFRKLWLHDAVMPAPDGSNHQVCRFCGTILSSPNISVRKKVCKS